MRSKSVVAALLLLSLFIPALGPEGSSKSAIQGTYRLVSRDLPDGTKVMPPEIQGMLTYTGRYRNFNIYLTGPDRKRYSLAYIAEYELTEDTYSETNVYRMTNDEIGGAGLSYDLSPQSGSATVTRKNGSIAFDLPLWGEPSVVFSADGFTATREGEFVDHWERVD